MLSCDFYSVAMQPEPRLVMTCMSQYRGVSAIINLTYKWALTPEAPEAFVPQSGTFESKRPNVTERANRALVPQSVSPVPPSSSFASPTSPFPYTVALGERAKHPWILRQDLGLSFAVKTMLYSGRLILKEIARYFREFVGYVADLETQ